MTLNQSSRIIKIGNSKGVRIPRKLLEQARLIDKVEITLQGDRLVIHALPPSEPVAGEIAVNEKEQPFITGTNMKVIELVTEHITYGWSPEEIKHQHPELSMGEIYKALAYYWDHKEKIDREIEEQSKAIERLRNAASDSPTRKKLRARGAL